MRHKLLKPDHKKVMVTIPIEDRGERFQQFDTLWSHWSEPFIRGCPWCGRDLNNLSIGKRMTGLDGRIKFKKQIKNQEGRSTIEKPVETNPAGLHFTNLRPRVASSRVDADIKE
jgi:hypothetical protein